jgi:hypothetical protein
VYIVESWEKLRIKIPQNNKSLENIENFQRVETNQNSMHEEFNTF